MSTGVIWLLLCVLVAISISVSVVAEVESQSNASADNSERIYFLKKCGGAGCPYTASWMIHIGLFRKLTWWLDITKMEAASFNV
jgi:hypothetical protein